MQPAHTQTAFGGLRLICRVYGIRSIRLYTLKCGHAMCSQCSHRRYCGFRKYSILRSDIEQSAQSLQYYSVAKYFRAFATYSCSGSVLFRRFKCSYRA